MSNANIIFLIGTPASGKSNYAAHLFPNHAHLSMGEYQDKLWQEHQAAGAPHLSAIPTTAGN